MFTKRQYFFWDTLFLSNASTSYFIDFFYWSLQIVVYMLNLLFYASVCVLWTIYKYFCSFRADNVATLTSVFHKYFYDAFRS